MMPTPDPPPGSRVGTHHHDEEVQWCVFLTKSSQGQKTYQYLQKEVVSNHFFSPMNACNFGTDSDNSCRPDIPLGGSVCWQHHFAAVTVKGDRSAGCHPNQIPLPFRASLLPVPVQREPNWGWQKLCLLPTLFI